MLFDQNRSHSLSIKTSVEILALQKCTRVKFLMWATGIGTQSSTKCFEWRDLSCLKKLSFLRTDSCAVLWNITYLLCLAGHLKHMRWSEEVVVEEYS
jgi:hypothetical protein